LSCLEVPLVVCPRRHPLVRVVNGWKGVGRAYNGQLRNVSPDPVVCVQERVCARARGLSVLFGNTVER